MSNTENIYEQVTNKIIADLEQGKVTWRQPWSIGQLPNRPRRSNGVAYSGINTLLLWSAAAAKGYKSPFWFTFKQAANMKATVRDEEKTRGTPVVYGSSYPKTIIDENGRPKQTTIPFLRVFEVFNADQIDDLPGAYSVPQDQEAISAQARVAELEEFFRQTKADIITGPEPLYRKDKDLIEMPPFEAFTTAPDYYATLGHELTHWTGHSSRLARTFGKKPGDDVYAREELIAELGASFLAADLGLAANVQSQRSAYIQHYVKILKNDKRFIFRAASSAQKAVEYLHGLQRKNDGNPHFK